MESYPHPLQQSSGLSHPTCLCAGNDVTGFLVHSGFMLLLLLVTTLWALVLVHFSWADNPTTFLGKSQFLFSGVFMVSSTSVTPASMETAD